jgi:trehalose-phosphatase
VARVPRLLVASDYDGTLAPIVADPERAWPVAESVAALGELAALPATAAAVVTGRALRDLAALCRMPAGVRLVGSHGSEFEAGFGPELDDEAKAVRARLLAELRSLVDGVDGVRLEEKPASVAVHVRQAAPAAGERVLAAVRSGSATWPAVSVTEGKAVIELAVLRTDKGDALDVLRHEVTASAVVFVGDDVTDERAFALLGGPDVGVKVGPAATAAGFRVADPAAVATVLAVLTAERSAWLRR